MHAPRVLPILLASLFFAARSETEVVRQTPQWSLRTRLSCSGGPLVAADFDATGARLLTAGEDGDLCLWNPARAVVQQNMASGARHVAAVRLHPRESWAIVLADWCQPPPGVERVRGCFATWRVDLASGRRQLLWRRPVADLAFERDGARVAMLLPDPTGLRRQLQVCSDAALLAGNPTPDFECAVDCEGYLQFEPGGAALLLRPWSHNPSLRVPLDGAPLTPCSGRIATFDDDGNAVLEPERDPPVASAGDWSVTVRGAEVRRDGPRPRNWTIAGADWTLGDATRTAIARNGTVIVGDLHGNVHLLTDARTASACPHLGPPLQLLFDATGTTLAVVGRTATTFVDWDSGTGHTVIGSCAVQALDGGSFAVLRGNEVRAYDRAAGELATSLFCWGGPGAARTHEVGWTREAWSSPWLWCAQRAAHGSSLWLGAVTSGDEPWPRAVALVHGTPAVAAAIPYAVDDERLSPNLEPIAILPLVRSGRVAVFERERAIQCGTGLRPDRCRAAIRTFTADGCPLTTRGLHTWIAAARPLPDQRHAVLLPEGSLVDLESLRVTATSAADWCDFAATGSHEGLAADGSPVLLRVELPAMQTRRLPPLPDIERIDAVAAARGGRLLAVADGGRIALFARERP